MINYNEIKLKVKPAQVLVIGFALVIILGAFLLSLPQVTNTGQSIGFLDAFFTSTSAVCVTGLVVVDTATTFNIVGRTVIMLLIFVGGLGIVTIGTAIFLILGKRISFHNRMLIQESLNQFSLQGMVRLLKAVVVTTISIILIGSLILFVRFLSLDYPLGKALYYALFHSVSAFNNAGFDLFGEYSSLTRFVDDTTINITIAALIILGGIGFSVIRDVVNYRKTKKLVLHTKIVLTTTLALIIVGFLGVFFFEYNNPNTLGSLNIKGKILASFFQSVSPRTAGFNTVDLTQLHDTTKLLTIMLMFIGASPGSTGGGVKTTTFVALALAMWTVIRGKDNIHVFKRRIEWHQIIRGFIIIVSAMFLILGMTMALLYITGFSLMEVMFEVTSAFGTVGLSLGITPHLPPAAKLLIALTMFMGRVGPLTLAFAIAQKKQGDLYKYPADKILIG